MPCVYEDVLQPGGAEDAHVVESSPASQDPRGAVPLHQVQQEVGLHEIGLVCKTLLTFFVVKNFFLIVEG